MQHWTVLSNINGKNAPLMQTLALWQHNENPWPSKTPASCGRKSYSLLTLLYIVQMGGIAVSSHADMTDMTTNPNINGTLWDLMVKTHPTHMLVQLLLQPLAKPFAGTPQHLAMQASMLPISRDRHSSNNQTTPRQSFLPQMSQEPNLPRADKHRHPAFCTM
jgi:hypothetical protein